MRSMKLRVGLVGAGAISVESHLPILKKHKDIEITGICDPQIALAKEAASKFGVKNTFSDLSEMLLKEKPDAVDICAPPNTHLSLSIQALEAGCHVLVEKPMAANVQEVDKMVDAAKRYNAKLCVVHQNLFNPVVIKAKHLIESGEVGELLNVTAMTLERNDGELCSNQNHWCHKLTGGIFYEILPHPIYLLQSFLGDMEPVSVLGKKLGDKEWLKNDEVRVTINGRKGLGNVIASCNSFLHGDYLYILGTKLALEINLWGRVLIKHKPHSTSALGVGKGNMYLSAQLLNVVGSTFSTAFSAVRGKASAHHEFITAFIDSILKNTDTPTTGKEGRETAQILQKICEQLI